MKSIAFIIPHMGRENLLLDTLQSITQLDSDGFDVSVVVVSKNTEFSEQLLAYKQQCNAQFIQADLSITISDQRNLGVEATDSEYLAFIDADIDLSRNWLHAMFSELDKPNVVLASAVQVASENAPQLEHVRVVLSNLSVDCEMEFLPGRNLCLSREIFDKTGGFPSHLVTCEDYVFTQNVGQFGSLFYTSKASYIHLGEDKEFWPMAKKEVWRGQSNLASIKGRKVPISEYPSFIIPPAFTGMLCVFILALLFSFPVIAGLCALGCVAILAMYTLRLLRKRDKQPSVLAIVTFYALYFPARTIGTVLGAVKNLQTNDYKT